MRFGFSEVCLGHDPGMRHPESPDRLRAIREGLSTRHGVEYVDAPPADTGVIETVHDGDYVAEIREFCEDGGGEWDPDTVAVEGTWAAARQSAGLAAWAAEAALDGDDGRETPFAIGRPPGHHATAGDAMGFCFLNNASIAAQRALDTVDRVAVFDWDVHHGNGTQDIFYDRGDVFYASAHEDGLYPGTGDVSESGDGDGAGTTLNAPLPAGGGDAEYVYVLEELLAPALDRFDPDLLLVSAGFDAHRHDPISRMHLSTEGYGLLTDCVRTIAADTGAALAFVLEGGYGLDTLAEGVGMVHETFDGRDPLDPEDDVDEAVTTLVADVRDEHPLF